ncbi:ParA family protein (plasmid) [Candidatus Bandiella woodruffii]|uniref:ParA family protein n=2 Tax=Candidatus Bandiella euplotis TaxID=1664265 RepID=A0ABZ0UMQ7_9RICK|nr:ParA family protein [Candidatus Bandiella woodruffii]
MNPKMLATEAADFLNISLPAIHKQLKSKNLFFSKNKNKVFFNHESAKKIFNLTFKPTCWSWLNLKGGVGKTNLSFATAIRLSLFGAKILVIDLDQQANFTQACGINSENKPILIDILRNKYEINQCISHVIPGLDIVPSRIDNAVLDNMFSINNLPVDRVIKRVVDNLKHSYDFVFIDCPPSLNATSSSAALASDCIIIPLDPEKFSLSGLEITLNELHTNVFKVYEKFIDTKILLNKFDARTSLSHETLSHLLSKVEYKNKIFNTFIRTSQDFPNAIANNLSIFDNTKPSTAKEDVNLLAIEIINSSKITQGVIDA